MIIMVIAAAEGFMDVEETCDFVAVNEWGINCEKQYAILLVYSPLTKLVMRFSLQLRGFLYKKRLCLIADISPRVDLNVVAQTVE